ncbi:hypothetical protein [Saccharothrix sp.]|uniref:hypothetical protein n=1 Tax=Saccharothrix sp. TaxID=1873460 RepID=UPI0028123571|nr:hypothetical protein [Saccharothrix sp.]
MQDLPDDLSRFDHDLVLVLSKDRRKLSLKEAVDIIRLESGEQVNLETVIAEGRNPLEWIQPKALWKFDHATRRGVHYAVIPDEHGSFVLSAWSTEHRGVFHLAATVPVTDPRWKKVERWIGRATPNLVPCFLNHADFADIGAALANLGEAEVSRLTARSLLDQSSTTRGWKSRSDSLRPTPIDAIGEAEANHTSVRTMTIRVGDILNVHLRRLAGATFYSGRFEVFEAEVLTRLAAAVASRRNLMGNRQRRIGAPMGAPISIKLPGPFLGAEIDTGEVLSTLEEFSQTSIAVLHRNPYLHVVVTDYSDGSNFDVFVTDPETIEIYPGYRASLGSLTRLSQRLGERFLATDIREAADEPVVNLSDLVASR